VKRKGIKEMWEQAEGNKNPRYLRIGVFRIDEVLPFIFTREVRKSLSLGGFEYTSPEWKGASRHSFPVEIDGRTQNISVRMGSHRYQMFAEKGTICQRCGLEGKFFALEKAWSTKGKKFHFNLYGFDSDKKEVMLTKDHIHPRSKGGKNNLDNYQVLCETCNSKKADKIKW
jgi:hypothetical protein